MIVKLLKVEIRKKINAVAEKIKQEKPKKPPMKEIKSNIVQSERVEDETKGSFYLPLNNRKVLFPFLGK